MTKVSLAKVSGGFAIFSALALLTAGSISLAAGAEPVTFTSELTVPVQIQSDPAIMTPSLRVWLGDDEVEVASREVGNVGVFTLSVSGSQTQPIMIKDNCPKQQTGVRLKVTEATPGTQVVARFTPSAGDEIVLGAYTIADRMGKASTGVCV